MYQRLVASKIPKFLWTVMLIEALKLSFHFAILPQFRWLRIVFIDRTIVSS